MKEFVVTEETNLKKFTDNTYPQGMFFLHPLLKSQNIRVNGVSVSKNCPLHAGDWVAYFTTPEQEAAPVYETVYEDKNVIVCDKASGVNSNALFVTLSQKGECYYIHRLDRNTQGLIIFAKNKGAEAELLDAFRRHATEKKYLAVCYNPFPKDAGYLVAYLRKDARESKVTISDNPSFGVRIETGYRVLKREGDLTLVEVLLHTGRMHQIRAHLAHVGNPVAGDEKYGDIAQNDRYHARRQRLLSYSLRVYPEGKLAYLKNKTFLSSRTLRIGDKEFFAKEPYVREIEQKNEPESSD